MNEMKLIGNTPGLIAFEITWKDLWRLICDGFIKHDGLQINLGKIED